MSHVRTYVITVVLSAGGARSDLLAMAAALRRRHVAVLEAALARPVDGRRVFSATFQASPVRAQSVLRTFQGQVDTLASFLFATGESDEPDQPGPQSMPARGLGDGSVPASSQRRPRLARR